MHYTYDFKYKIYGKKFDLNNHIVTENDESIIIIFVNLLTSNLKWMKENVENGLTNIDKFLIN